MTETIKRSQMVFDNRLTSITSDTNQILNRTCTTNGARSLPRSFMNSNKLFSLDDAPMQSPKHPFGSPGSPTPFSSSSFRTFNSGNKARETRTREVNYDLTLDATQNVTHIDKLI